VYKKGVLISKECLVLCVSLRGPWLEGRRGSTLPSHLINPVSAQKTLLKEEKEGCTIAKSNQA